jgi:hypothetical protein
MAPSKPGQVCKLLHPFPDENPEEIYIVAEDPSPFEDADNIYTVILSNLQHNIKSPLLTPQVAIQKSDLIVIAEDLENYIVSWNK